MGIFSIQNLLAAASAICYHTSGFLLMVDGSIENGDLDNRHLSGNIFPSFREQRPSPREEAAHLEQSYFDETVPRNVTVLIGKSAYLSCRVRNLGNKSVSWIRHRDIHILTVNSYTYTTDQRFQTNHHPQTDEWTLQIKWAQMRDAGTYECQLSSQPVKSYFVNLFVVDTLKGDEVSRMTDTQTQWSHSDDIYHQMFADPSVPTAQILGSPDLFVEKGSTFNLTCVIRFSPETPAFIVWFHHDNVIRYDSKREGVSVITKKGTATTSFLLIQNADISDSGKYSCSPSSADVASIRVHVLNGETPAAMQTGSAVLYNNSFGKIVLVICGYNFIIFYTSISPIRLY